MGYTHYWRISQVPLGKQRRNELVRAITVVVGARKDILAGPDGRSPLPPIPHTALESNGADIVVFNGRGFDSYESFWLELQPPRVIEAGGNFRFCKTEGRPYDEVVVAVLCLCEHIAPLTYSVSSDGSSDDWQQGLALARTVDPVVKLPRKIFRTDPIEAAALEEIEAEVSLLKKER